MSAYALVKTLHIVSATLLFGTGLGSAFYLWRADRSRDPVAIAFAARNVGRRRSTAPLTRSIEEK